MVNFFTVTGGKLIECQKQEIGKLIGCQCGKQIQCQVVNFFIDIHILAILQIQKSCILITLKKMVECFLQWQSATKCIAEM